MGPSLWDQCVVIIKGRDRQQCWIRYMEYWLPAASRTRENKFLLFMLLSLCFVTPVWVKTNDKYSVIYSYKICIINEIFYSNKNGHITDAHVCELKVYYTITKINMLLCTILWTESVPHSNKNEHITDAHVCELKMYYAGEKKPATKGHIMYHILIFLTTACLMKYVFFVVQLLNSFHSSS